jgi:ABC-type polysaccharide/polyol phosphate transport system ATPase subunit
MKTMVRLENVVLHFPRRRDLLTGLLDLLKGKNTAGKGKFTALTGVDLEVNKGEVLGVIGRNGSGKSTMLRAMAGIYRPDEGIVQVRGRTSLLAGVSVGLNQNLTGRENVHLYGSILGHNRDIMESMMGDILEFSDIGEFFELPLRTYSAGMKARLGLAIASAIEPEILLIDEVLGVGDPQFREKSKQRILDLVKNTGTVVLVSHSFGLMREICDRVALIHEGKVHCVGDPTQTIRAYWDLTGDK